MAVTSKELLAFNLQEKQFPYFDDTELDLLLEQANGDVNLATYRGCLIKAQNDAISLGPIDIVSNEKYWLRRARQFSPNYTGPVQRSDENAN